jgi:acetyltransferase-like isoleucine patch superfamily enzyme
VISPHAVVETEAIGARPRIGEFSIVRAGAVLGDDVTIHPHAIVEAGVTLENEVEVLPFAYIGRAPTPSVALARQPDTAGPVVIGAGTRIGSYAVVYTDVTTGPDCLLGDHAVLREDTRIGSQCILGVCVGADAGTRVGDRTKAIAHTILAGEVGSDVFISVMVGVATDNTFGRSGYDPAQARGPTIRDRALIGIGANLLPGVQIGYEAVVGAGSLVTRDVADGSLVMGVPARPVTRRGGTGGA